MAEISTHNQEAAQVEPLAKSGQDGNEVIPLSESKEPAGGNEPEAEIPEEDEVTPIADLAQWWLDFGLNHKYTKRNCMTFP